MSHKNPSQTYSSSKSANHIQKNQNQLAQTFSQIQLNLNIRRTIIQQTLQTNVSAEKYLTSANKYKIVNHCNQYSKIVSLVNGIVNGNSQYNPLMSYQTFWQTNQNLQRQLEQQLRQLKSIDTIIDNIVNQQFDKCNQIDEIQQTIRIILSRKQANHISKAQPYYQSKQKCINYLNEKKGEKEKTKQQKLNLIKQILKLLDHLKKHRQGGLKMCVVQQKQKKNQQNNLILLERTINDFKQVFLCYILCKIQKNQSQLGNYETQLVQLVGYIKQTQIRIQQYSKAILQLISQQNQACSQFESIAKMKYETQYFQNTLFSMFGIQNIKKSSKKQYNNQIQNILSKLEKSLKQSKQKQKQALKIEQGIQTTRKTIQIFQHILTKIQTQNSRKKLLLKDIQKMQTKHFHQQRNLIQINQAEDELQKMKLKKNQLNKNLQSKVNQANVAAYKNIHQQILRLQNQIKIKAKQVQSFKLNVREDAKKLYDDTINLQKEYQDILSQVVPSIWFKGNDFTKQEAIKDLNLYLSKTFKRLSIVD